MERRVIPKANVAAFSQELKSQGKRLVTTNGCFDVLHWGHMQYLQAARELGDVLWVFLNSDVSVKSIKGEKRPVFGEAVRAKQLLSLRFVDFVSIFSDQTPIKILAEAKPDIHVKGGDYIVSALPETSVVESFGGEVRILPFEPGFSTSQTLDILNSLF